MTTAVGFGTRASLLAASLSPFGCATAAAQSDALLVFSNQHIIIDGGTPPAHDEMWQARPVPVSTATVERAATVGNLGIALSQRAGCGYRDERHRVFCFNQDWQLDAASQLELLSLAARALTIRVGSHVGAEHAAQVLALRPERLANVAIHESTDSSCAGDCARRMTVEWSA